MRARQISAQDVTKLEELWQKNPSAKYEDLKSVAPEKL
jgi:hypothetical protein